MAQILSWAQMTPFILLAAFVLDRIFGDPDWIWQRIPHPVVVFGKAIEWADREFNSADDDSAAQRMRGVMAIVLLVLGSVVLGLALSRLFEGLRWTGVVLEVLLVSILLAQKSLSDHVAAVAAGLREGGIEGGRRAVSMIVGRDVTTLDEAGVARAAIESLAENFSDGVMAPALFYLVFGLPGLIAYKMINTADSMIGHKNEKYRHFGWASARLDDLANLVPARLSAILILLAGGIPVMRQRFGVVWRDARLHRSPNSGWPESAMAACLGLALGGPRIYKGDRVVEPYMNGDGRTDAKPEDIDLALEGFGLACTLAATGVALITVSAVLFAALL